MTEDDSNNVDMDLDEFEKDFYQQRELEPEKADGPDEEEDDSTEEVPENEDNNPLATDEPSEEEEEETPEEEEPKPQPKKNSAQQRIERLLERERLANERADALERRLAALENGTSKEVKAESEPTQLRDTLHADAPNPDAVDDKGEPIYALGEFDPKYIRDLTRYTIKVETEAVEKERAAAAEQAKIADERNQIAQTWAEKVEKAEEDHPDIRERLGELQDVFGNLDPAYGEYLATTVMQSDYGAEIMYYLSQNIGEAQKIVASGPAAATLAFGRLEARFEKPQQEEKRNTNKVSKAPEPPSVPTRGSNGKFQVSGDTDDLDAFEREFYKPRKW